MLKVRQGFSDSRKAHFITLVYSVEGLLLSFRSEYFMVLFTERSHNAVCSLEKRAKWAEGWSCTH